MQKLSAKQSYPYISAKKILKILFQVKEQLPDNNPLKKHLAYYWYRDGPYSDVIASNIDVLKKEDKITEHVKSNKKTYVYKIDCRHVPIVKQDEDIGIVRKKIGEKVDEFINIGDTVNDIYDDAPFRWYKTYRLTFRSHFEDFCKNQPTDRTARYTSDNILNELDDVVLDYPAEPRFIELRPIVMDFAKILGAFLLSNAYLKHNDKLDILQNLCCRIWEVFAYGVRLECHDSYYNDRINEWQRIYENNLARLDGDIQNYQKTFDKISVDTRKFAPDIEDIILHPERHTFTPLVLDDLFNNSNTSS